MLCKLFTGDQVDQRTNQYYAECEEDVNDIPGDAPIASTVIILDKQKGLSIRMKNSDGEWVNIEGDSASQDIPV